MRTAKIFCITLPGESIDWVQVLSTRSLTNSLAFSLYGLIVAGMDACTSNGQYSNNQQLRDQVLMHAQLATKKALKVKALKC